MTLILARVTGQFIIQVSDRLVSNVTTQTPFDPMANKCILYIASNAVVAIAYTGTAYINHIPTDQYLAQILLGQVIDPNNIPMMSTEIRNKSDIGLSMRKILEELNSQGNLLDIILTYQGWQWDHKGHVRPIVGVINKDSQNKRYSISQEKRDFYLAGSLTISTPRSNLSEEEINKLSIALRNKTIIESEEILINEIRRISAENQWVGPHCMSISIPHPSTPNIHINFSEYISTEKPESKRKNFKQMDFSYSPWVISQNIYLPPNEIIGGGFNICTGPFTIRFDTNVEHKSELFIGGSEGQKRKKL
jgi:hypothetical protein